MAVGLCVLGLPAGAARAFPEVRPATRAEAVQLLCDGAEAIGPCLRERMHVTSTRDTDAPLTVRRAVALLERGIAFADQRRLLGPDERVLRYTVDEAAFDRVDRTDHDASGLPDVVEATRQGLAEARALLIEELELATPAIAEVLLVELGRDLDGYVIPRRDAGSTLVLDATPTGGAEEARRAAVRIYAHAVALQAGPSFPVAWAEALSTWAVLALDRVPDTATADQLSARLRRSDRGLVAEDVALGPGNALWLAFVEQAYGRPAVRLTVEELARPIPLTAALDRAVRRASHDDLAAAFREFHVWTLLVGGRADGHHFDFAARLDSPAFAAQRLGLPALSVQSEPPLAPLGATQVLLRPDARVGGMRVHFEGDFSATWEADLLLVAHDGHMHRLPIAVSGDGRGEITIPLPDVDEVMLLVRNLGGVDDAPRPYSYAAHREKGFPFELVQFDATHVDGGVEVAWETASELQLVGFNVVRTRREGTQSQVVNPVWVPALGSSTDSTSYRFLDRTADPDTHYVYEIQGITTSGLSTFSEPVVVAPVARTR